MADAPRFQSSLRALSKVKVRADVPTDGAPGVQGGDQSLVGREGARQERAVGVDPVKVSGDMP